MSFRKGNEAIEDAWLFRWLSSSRPNAPSSLDRRYVPSGLETTSHNPSEQSPMSCRGYRRPLQSLRHYKQFRRERMSETMRVSVRHHQRLERVSKAPLRNVLHRRFGGDTFPEEVTGIIVATTGADRTSKVALRY